MTEFTAKFMRGVLYGEHDNVEIIENKITGNSRWSLFYDLVFKMDGKFYKTDYSVGATESQDERPWEYSNPEVKEVFPKHLTITVYE